MVRHAPNREREETHQWVYGRVSLKAKLISAGYKDVFLQSHDSSLYRNWVDYGLDVDESGCERKPGSLYMGPAVHETYPRSVLDG